jgi:hypothetical protein
MRDMGFVPASHCRPRYCISVYPADPPTLAAERAAMMLRSSDLWRIVDIRGMCGAGVFYQHLRPGNAGLEARTHPRRHKMRSHQLCRIFNRLDSTVTERLRGPQATWAGK